MKKLVAAVFCLALVGCSMQLRYVKEHSGHAPALALSYSAYIMDEHASAICGATFIDANRVVTAAHCVDPGYHLLDTDAGVCLGEVVKHDATLDLALLKVECLRKHIPAKISPAPRAGTPVWLVGATLTEPGVLLRGYVAKRKAEKMFPGHSTFIVDADIFGGNSGGGVFTEQGLLVGLVTHRTTRGVGLAWCVPGSAIWRFVNG